MNFRQTGTILVGLCTLAACSSAPDLSAVQARAVVRTTLAGCDSAVNVLTVNLDHATPVGVVRMAHTVQEQCGAATIQLLNARLPGRVFEPCQLASLAASSLGEAAESAANGASPSALVQLEDASTKAAGARSQCDSAIA